MSLPTNPKVQWLYIVVLYCSSLSVQESLPNKHWSQSHKCTPAYYVREKKVKKFDFMMLYSIVSKSAWMTNCYWTRVIHHKHQFASASQKYSIMVLGSYVYMITVDGPITIQIAARSPMQYHQAVWSIAHKNRWLEYEHVTPFETGRIYCQY